MKKADIRRKASAGFTLVEVMLVIVIIGIMAGIALPKLSGKTKKAQISKAKQEISNLGLALDLYEVDNGAYPSSLNGLVSKPGNALNWDGPYMKKGKVPKDPWGKDYQYSASGGSYEIKSSGPDGGSAISSND